MSKKFVVVLLSLVMMMLLALPMTTSAQDDTIVIGFLPGVVDPFYQLMEVGVRQAVEDSSLDIELVVQIPEMFSPTVQTPILDAMVARGDLDYLIIAATDKEQMVAPLQAAFDAGIEIISVDTFIGDGDYVNGPVTFPLSYIGSDNTEGGRIAARALAANVGEEGKVYIQNVNPGISTTDQRQQGFEEGIAEFPNMEVVGVDFNGDDESTAVQQTEAVLQREEDLVGIFGTNVFSANGAGIAVNNAGLAGAVDVIAFDATIFAAEQLRAGVVSMMIAQKPFDMGYLAVQFAIADHQGVTSLPKRVPTGFAVITADNIDDPEVARFIYEVAEN
ncbi:MAG: sugar ABC transporter substrate-binding protein [Chloroflexi bacterium]|nr:MAG: sugar ABC transporter substrate-binding protein [Chloroflexota bacterium]